MPQKALQEWRQVRKEQDEAYQQSLAQDQLKEEKRQKRIQIEKVDYIMHVVVTNDGHFVYIGS